MKIFLDTANVEEIKKINEFGILDGVTTNPTLLSKEGDEPIKVIKKICKIVNGPVSVEVISTTADEMVNEAKEIAKIDKKIVVKIPMTPDGLKAVKTLSANGIKTNMTLIFSPLQALLAMKAGASFVSPFIGRLDDISHYGMEIVSDICKIIENYRFKTEVIVASIRHPIHVLEAALNGAHIATIPYKVLEQMFKHPLTDIGLDKFLKDWREKVKK
jgi:transaldolase